MWITCYAPSSVSEADAPAKLAAMLRDRAAQIGYTVTVGQTIRLRWSGICRMWAATAEAQKASRPEEDSDAAQG